MTTVQKVAVGTQRAINTTSLVAKGANSPAREKSGRRRSGVTHQIGHTALLPVRLWFLKWQVEVKKAGRLR